MIIIVYNFAFKLQPRLAPFLKIDIEKQYCLTLKCYVMSIYITYFIYAVVGIWIYRLLAYFFDEKKELKSSRKKSVKF